MRRFWTARQERLDTAIFPLYLPRMIIAPLDAIDRSLLAHRAAELGVPDEQICLECRWPKVADGRCVSIALHVRRAPSVREALNRLLGHFRPNILGAAGLAGPRVALAVRDAPLEAFAPCSGERPRVQRVRLEAIMSALAAAARPWDVATGYSVGRHRPHGSGWLLVDMVFESHRSCVRLQLGTFVRLQSGTLSRRMELADAFETSLLSHELTGWCSVHEICRQHYPAEVLPALDAVHAAWVAFREVA